METETIYKGQEVACPQCGCAMTVPERKSAAPDENVEAPATEGGDLGDWRMDIAQIRQTLESNIDRANMTITQYMAEQRMTGGVDLAGGSTASSILTADQGRKYEIGDVVEHGGMGAILDAKDVNVRRTVVLLQGLAVLSRKVGVPIPWFGWRRRTRR